MVGSYYAWSKCDFFVAVRASLQYLQYLLSQSCNSWFACLCVTVVMSPKTVLREICPTLNSPGLCADLCSGSADWASYFCTSASCPLARPGAACSSSGQHCKLYPQKQRLKVCCLITCVIVPCMSCLVATLASVHMRTYIKGALSDWSCASAWLLPGMICLTDRWCLWTCRCMQLRHNRVHSVPCY